MYFQQNDERLRPYDNVLRSKQKMRGTVTARVRVRVNCRVAWSWNVIIH